MGILVCGPHYRLERIVGNALARGTDLGHLLLKSMLCAGEGPLPALPWLLHQEDDRPEPHQSPFHTTS